MLDSVNSYNSTGWDYTASVDFLSWIHRSLSTIFAALGQCCQCHYNEIICISINSPNSLAKKKKKTCCGVMFYLVILINIRIEIFSSFCPGPKVMYYYVLLASTQRYTVFQRWPSLCLFLNMIIFVVIFYICSEIYLYIIVLEIFAGSLQSSYIKLEQNVIKKTVWCRLRWNSHSWCLTLVLLDPDIYVFKKISTEKNALKLIKYSVVDASFSRTRVTNVIFYKYKSSSNSYQKIIIYNFNYSVLLDYNLVLKIS